MYLIIEKSDRLYASFETNEHFKQANKYRGNLTRIEPTVLDEECDLTQLPNWSYIVIDVKKKKIKRARAKTKKQCSNAVKKKKIKRARAKTKKQCSK